MDIVNLLIKVGFDEVDKAQKKIEGLKGALQTAQNAGGAMGSALSSSFDAVSSAAALLEAPIIAVASALTAAATGAIALGFKAIEAADAMNDMATRTGRTAEYLTVLGSVAEKSGSNLNSLVDALDQVRKKSTAGDEEGKKVAAAYEYLGVKAREANGTLRDAADIASDGAEALMKMGQSADATAAFQDAFGASALKVLPTLIDLNKQIDQEYEFLSSVGALMDGNLTAASDNYNDKLHDLGSVFKGLGNDIARMMLPGLTGMADAMINSAKNSGVLSVALDIVKGAVWLVTGALKGVLTFFIAFDNGFSNIVQSIKLGGEVIWAAMTGRVDEIPKLWDAYKNRIIQTNIDAAAAVQKVWSTVEAAPQSKEDFKKGKKPELSKGGYNPYTKPDAAPQMFNAEKLAEDALNKQLKALDLLRNASGVLSGERSRAHEIEAREVVASIELKEREAVAAGKMVTRMDDVTKSRIIATGVARDTLTLQNQITAAEQKSAEVIEKAKQSSLVEIESNKKKNDILKKFGSTQDDVNAALAEYNLLMAQGVLQAAEYAAFGKELNAADSERLIKLREEVELLRQKAGVVGAIAGQNAPDSMKSSLDSSLGSLKSPYETKMEELAKITAALDDWRSRDIMKEEEYAARKAQIARVESQTKLDMASGFFGNLASLSQSGNKKLARIGKAAAIAQATIDGILGVQKALASAPPPYNYALAAAVGVAAAVNVSKIASQGYKSGGYTGDGGTSEVAGVVHGREFVVNAEATAKNRGLLEAMNSGRGYESGGYVTPQSGMRSSPMSTPSGNAETIIHSPIYVTVEGGTTNEQTAHVTAKAVEAAARKVFMEETAKNRTRQAYAA